MFTKTSRDFLSVFNANLIEYFNKRQSEINATWTLMSTEYSEWPFSVCGGVGE